MLGRAVVPKPVVKGTKALSMSCGQGVSARLENAIRSLFYGLSHDRTTWKGGFQKSARPTKTT